MANIKFTAIDAAILAPHEPALIKALQEGYETGGGPTHIARTELDEFLVAFRPREDIILILALPSNARVVKRTWGGEEHNDVEPSPVEYAVPAEQVQLERGIEGKPALC